MLTGLVFGLAPAIQATHPNLGSWLKDQSANLTTSGGQARLRRIFIVAQVALSLLLLVGAGLFARSLLNLMTIDPGFRAEKVLRFSVDPSLNGYDAPRGWTFYNDLQHRLALLPGVRSVAPPVSGHSAAACAVATSPSRVIAPRKTKKSAPRLTESVRITFEP